MQNYQLTEQAELDILGIWRYTAKNWGRKQADYYFNQIENCFKKIAQDQVISKQPIEKYTKLKSVKCEHHYIFFITGKKPTIIAILNEKMDFISRLENRLNEK